MSKYFFQEYNEKTLQRCTDIELLIEQYKLLGFQLPSAKSFRRPYYGLYCEDLYWQ